MMIKTDDVREGRLWRLLGLVLVAMATVQVLVTTRAAAAAAAESVNPGFRVVLTNKSFNYSESEKILLCVYN